MHIVYITLCLRDGSLYVGKHKQPAHLCPTDFDGYLGSGAEFKQRLAEHGADSFIRTTHSAHLTEEEALRAEQELIKKLSLGSQLQLLNVSTGKWSGSERQRTSSREKLARDKSQILKTMQRLRASLSYAKEQKDSAEWSSFIQKTERELTALSAELKLVSNYYPAV